MQFRVLAASTVATAFLAACTVGPDYEGPPSGASLLPSRASFHRSSENIDNTRPQATSWWQLFQDPELNKLVSDSLTLSPTVLASEARLRQARASLRQQDANTLPTVGASALYLHADAPGLSNPALGTTGNVNLYDVGFDASWELDIFGGTRRALQVATAAAQASEADLQDLHVTLSAEVVQAYIGLRDEQQRLVLTRQSTALIQKVLDLVADQNARGMSSDADVARLRTQLEAVRGSEIPLHAQIEASLDRLAVLTGKPPGALDNELAQQRALPSLPAHVTVGDPATMLRRRPDIRRAERMLAASNAQIGVQISNYFPKVEFFGDIGWGSTDIGHLVSGSGFAPVAAPVLQWNVLDFGRTAARVNQAEAGRDEAIANYQSTVLGALEDAETSLSRFSHQRDNVLSLARIKASADHTLSLTRQRFSAGLASQIEVANDLRSQIDATQNLASGQALLLEDYAALQKSLGLGWEPGNQRLGMTSPSFADKHNETALQYILP